MSVERAPQRRHRRKRLAAIGATFVLAYFATAYLVIPLGWKRYASRHPELEDVPRVALTAAGIPADPLNVELIGPEKGLKRIMVNAHWYPADALTLRSCLEIAEASVLKRPYDDAPVSSEFLFGRKEDLSFEKPVGNNPRERHHVRFWRAPTADSQGARSGWAPPSSTKGSALAEPRASSRTSPRPTSISNAIIFFGISKRPAVSHQRMLWTAFTKSWKAEMGKVSPGGQMAGCSSASLPRQLGREPKASHEFRRICILKPQAAGRRGTS